MDVNLFWTLVLTVVLAAFISISFLLPVYTRTNKSVSANATVKVYDVTSFVDEHPGGDAIMNNAGADSTEGFFGPQHGTKVFEMLDDFYIGELAQ